jgi:hypothetical protein
VNKYKLICLDGTDIFDNEKPLTRKEIINRFLIWFWEHGITFHKVTFKNIKYYFNIKIVKIKTKELKK